MRNRFISLRLAVTLPLIVVLIATFVISIMRYRADYEFLAKEQCSKIVEALTNNTQNELNAILSQPLIMAEIIGYTITNEKMFLGEDLSDIENYQKSLMKSLKAKIPQISVISYGDENGNYIGIRDNGEGKDFSLMLKDSRTGGLLNIYEGDSIKSNIISSIEDYDPRIRPWYEPVRKNIASSWSNIYINQDEKMEATTSVSVPVFGNSGEFRGVFEIDVKLNGINDFLQNNKIKDNGVVFIVNNDLDIVAQSEAHNNAVITDSKNFKGELLKVKDSKNPLIKSTEALLKARDLEYKKVHRIEIEDSNNFVMVSKLENPHGLRWRIAVVIPENDLMGSIQSRYNLSLAMIMIMLILGTIAGIYILNKVTQPLLMVASGYNEITSGNWDVEIKQKRGHIKEVHEMIKGFNLMVDNIKSYIGKLVEKQNEIEELHKTETHRMNLIIDEKTENLKAVMEELMEKERLASLGELVSGVAHEINTPLGVAVSASSLMEANNESFKKELLEGSISKSGLVSYIESIDETTAILNSNLYRAAELVKSFKEIAVNQSIEEKSRFNFREYIDSILLSLKHEYKNKNVEFKIDCPDDLVINNYSGAISQVFTNLIMNSLIHGFKDMKSGQINISVAPEDENLIIHYKDNGLGMNEEVKKRAFEPFYTTNRGKGGSGLGMNIVYNLVTAKLNGKISCKSEINMGTEFIIEIKR